MSELEHVEAEAPEKLSDAIRLALRDLELVEKDDRYEIDMEEWHLGAYGNTRCHVCLAGAVMAKTCNVPIEEELYSHDFKDEWENTFEALDYVREFRLGFALDVFYQSMPDYVINSEDAHIGIIGKLLEKYSNTKTYDEDPSMFKKADAIYLTRTRGNGAMNWELVIRDFNNGTLDPEMWKLCIDNDGGYWEYIGPGADVMSLEGQEKMNAEMEELYGQPGGYQDVVDILRAAGVNADWV